MNNTTTRPSPPPPPHQQQHNSKNDVFELPPAWESLHDALLWLHGIAYGPLCVVGVLANIAVIVVLLRPAMRNNPFNVLLAVIAGCDMTLMTAYFIYESVRNCNPVFYAYGWMLWTRTFAQLSPYLHSASLWLTVNMAIFRYWVLKRGQSGGGAGGGARRSNKPKSGSMGAGGGAGSNIGMSGVAVVAFASFLVALLGALPNMFRYEIVVQIPQYLVSDCDREPFFVTFWTLVQPRWWSRTLDTITFWTAGVINKIVPCLLLTVFMTLLVRMLVEARERRRRLCGDATNKKQQQQQQPSNTGGAASGAPTNNGGGSGSNGNHNNNSSHGGSSSGGGGQAERTTAMLVAIVAVFLATELPQAIHQIGMGILPRRYIPAFRHLGKIADLLALINSSVNFVLCASMSRAFRLEFLHTFGCCFSCHKRHHLQISWLRRRTGTEGRSSRNGFLPVPSSAPVPAADDPAELGNLNDTNAPSTVVAQS